MKRILAKVCGAKWLGCGAMALVLMACSNERVPAKDASEAGSGNPPAANDASGRNYLAQHGVPRETIRIWSRGEHGAQGTDEETWALDRRVDFELGDRTGGVGTAADPRAGVPHNATLNSDLAQDSRLA